MINDKPVRISEITELTVGDEWHIVEKGTNYSITPDGERWRVSSESSSEVAKPLSFLERREELWVEKQVNGIRATEHLELRSAILRAISQEP